MTTKNLNELSDLDFLEALGKHIKELREERGWSQIEFADRLGVKRMQIYRIEHGKSNVGILTLKKVANILDWKLIDTILN